jgi:hypothetical protein
MRNLGGDVKEKRGPFNGPRRSNWNCHSALHFEVRQQFGADGATRWHSVAPGLPLHLNLAMEALFPVGTKFHIYSVAACIFAKL